MISVIVNGINVTVPGSYTVMQAAALAGFEIPSQ